MREAVLDVPLPLAAQWESVARRILDVLSATFGLLVLTFPLIVVGLVIR